MFVCLVIPSFHVASNIFSSMLHFKLGLHHLIPCGLAHYIYGYFIHLMGIHFIWCSLKGEHICNPQCLFRMHLFSLLEMLGFMFHLNKCIFLLSFLKFSLWESTSIHHKWGPHSSWCCHTKLVQAYLVLWVVSQKVVTTIMTQTKYKLYNN